MHRLLGKIYMALMFTTALLFAHSCDGGATGSRPLWHHSPAFLSRVVLRTLVPTSPLKRDVTAHRGHMIGVYVGGILVAGLFTLAPGRYLHQLLFG